MLCLSFRLEGVTDPMRSLPSPLVTRTGFDYGHWYWLCWSSSVLRHVYRGDDACVDSSTSLTSDDLNDFCIRHPNTFLVVVACYNAFLVRILLVLIVL